MSASALKYHEDNDNFRTKLNKDVDSVYRAIQFNPFEISQLSALHNSIPFLQSVSDELKQILSTGENQVKEFISDRLLMRKLPITGTISKNNFLLLKNQSSKNDNPIKLTIPFMNKLRSAVEHRTIKDDEFFNGEIYGVPQCFSIDGTDQMYHSTKSSIQDRLPSYHEPIIPSNDKKAIIINFANT